MMFSYREKKKSVHPHKLSWHWEVRSWPFIWNVRTVIWARHYVALTASCDTRAVWQDLRNWSSSADWPMWHCGLKCSSVCLLCLCISNEQDRPPPCWGGGANHTFWQLSLLKEAHWKPQKRHKYFRPGSSTIGPDNIRCSTSRRFRLNPQHPLSMDAARSGARNAQRAHP